MDILKHAIDIALRMIDIEFVLFGATLSFMDIALFFGFAGIIVLFVGGMMK